MAASKRDSIRLIVNLSIIACIVIALFFVFRSCFGKKDTEWELTQTPLKVENIRKIAEISTVNYKDELVVDSIEYYKDVTEQVAGNFSKLKDLENWKYSVRGSAVKRRLTLIVGGEVRFGFNLKDAAFDVKASEDSIFIQLPEPKILDVLIVPSGTSVFQEHGEWHDNARVKMQKKAERTFTRRSQNLELDQKSKQQVEKLLRKIMSDSRVVIITYK